MLGLVFVALWIWALVDVIRTPDENQRSLPKPAWFFVVLLFFVLGAMAWLVFGRPRSAGVGLAGGGRAGPRPGRGGGWRGRRLSEARDDAANLSERERHELERREYYKRMDEELDRRLEEKRRREEGDSPAGA